MVNSEAVQVDGSAMELYVAAPDGAGPFPGVVVIQHAGGVDEFTRGMADRLAAAGYVAAAPELYHRIEDRVERENKMAMLRQLRDPELEADVGATVEFLAAHQAVDAAALGITGFCMGGRVVYLMAAADPRFKAAVAYYGGNIMVPWGDGPAPYQRSVDISCPLMFHFGAEDGNPSPQDREQLAAELTRLGKAHQFFEYQGAGHAFMDFTRAERHRPAAAAESWARTLDFFAAHLRGA